MKIVYLYDGTPCMVYKDEEGEYQYPNDEWTEVSPPEGLGNKLNELQWQKAKLTNDD